MNTSVTRVNWNEVRSVDILETIFVPEYAELYLDHLKGTVETDQRSENTHAIFHLIGACPQDPKMAKQVNNHMIRCVEETDPDGSVIHIELGWYPNSVRLIFTRQSSWDMIGRDVLIQWMEQLAEQFGEDEVSYIFSADEEDVDCVTVS